jgi:hypothetical protein
VALQLLSRVDGFLIWRRQEEHGARNLALLASGVGDLPAELVRVIADGADFIFLNRNLKKIFH